MERRESVVTTMDPGKIGGFTNLKGEKTVRGYQITEYAVPKQDYIYIIRNTSTFPGN